VKRGKANALKEPVKKGLNAAEALEHFAQTAEDVAVEDVINKMTKVLVIDGDTKGQDTVDPSSALSIEAFNEALKEDNAALAAEFGVEAAPPPDMSEGDGGAEEEEPEEEEEALPVSEAVQSVRSEAEPFNWVLIGPRA